MKKTVVIVISAVVLIAAALGVSFAVDKGVTWTPGQVSATAVWAKTSTSSISFVSDKNLNKVDVRIDPALQPYLSVAPASLGKVSKDQQVTLTLTFAVASNTPPHVVSGNLTLFKDNGAAKVFGALPVTVSLEPVTLPPDPGDAGKATLEGIDSDHDGIRDDIQRYMALMYWDKPVIVAGLRQYAKPLQQALLDANSKGAALQHDESLSRADDCLQALIGFNNQVATRNALLTEFLNTNERSRAYIQYDSQLGGGVYDLRGLSEITPALCDFNAQQLSGGVQ